jgi:exopolysaccharide biosynthesis polyprenyl glycosylphosphotransferase
VILEQEISGSSQGEVAATVMPRANPFTGSLFEPSQMVPGKVKHWKRHMVVQAFPYLLLFADVALITVLYLVAVDFRYEVATRDFSRRILAVLLASSILPVYFIGGYEYHQNMRSFRFISEHALMHLCGLLFAFFVIYAVSFYGQQYHSARSTVLIPLIGFSVVSTIYRYQLAGLKLRLRKVNALCIIGAGSEARDLYMRLHAAGISQTTFVADDHDAKVGEHLVPGDLKSPRVRRLADVHLNSSIDGKFVESYVLAKPLSSLPRDFVKRLVVAQFHGNQVYTYEAYLAEVLRLIPPTKVSLAWAFSEGFRLNREVGYDRVKRLSDLLLAVAGLIVSAPILAVVALAVRMTSSGPIIFRQTRVGEKERPFTLYKFRSMQVGSEHGAKYTQAGDARFTPIGAFIRKTRLDELPQLWNVLRGDLSVIGPRAEWIDLVRDYENKFPFYHFRHAVKPGITGWAQVNYSYGANDADTLEKLSYDLYYVRHYSLLLDITICVKTVYMMVFARGR